jgi:polyisoprenyl-phosphate glycosyltransferase
VLPAYNEVGHIGDEVDRITAALKASPYSFEILVDRRRLDRRHRRRRRGTAVRAPDAVSTSTAARDGPADRHPGGLRRYVVWTDADMTYPNERIPELIDILETGEVQQVVGARTSEEGTTRCCGSRRSGRSAAGRVPDLQRDPGPQLGLRAFARRRAALPRPAPHRASAASPRSRWRSCRTAWIEYVPIDYAKRAGRSHFHPIKDAYRYILQMVRMVTFFEPLRVFAPLALESRLASAARHWG